MAGAAISDPPILDNNTNYESWLKDLKVWELYTNTELKKRGPRLYLCLKGKAREIVRDLDINIIGADNGVELIVKALDGHYSKDKVQRAYMALENFERFRRSSNMEMNEYVTQFEHLNTKIKEHDMALPDGILAYKLLHHANLGEMQISLIKATMKELTYKEIKSKMVTIHQDITNNSTIKTEPSIKVEGTYYASNENETYYTNRGRARGRGFRGRNGNRGQGSFRGDYKSMNQSTGRGQYNSQYKQRGQNWQGNSGRNRARSLNPPDESGETSRCAICQSIFHWARECPDAYENQNNSLHVSSEDMKNKDGEKEQVKQTRFPLFMSSEESIRLFTTDTTDEESEMNILLGECLSTAIIDSGAPETVSGKTWVKEFINTLSEEEQKEVQRCPATKRYKFGNSKAVEALERVKLPMTIAKENILLTVDVVDVDVPLLISKKTLKDAGAVINFHDDTITMFGRKETLLESQSGHYHIPVHNHIDVKEKSDSVYSLITFIMNTEENDEKRARKIHRHFSHARKEKLQKLLEDGGWWNQSMSKALSEVEEKCKVCKIFPKPYSRPVVGFSYAKAFNDVIGMDLKDFHNRGKKYKLMNIVDLCTRFCQCVRVSSKKKEEIIEALMRSWIQIFGPPSKVLSDNGGEFLNEDMVELADKFGIKIKMTAAEAPWSNGIVERHNGVINDTLQKTMEDIDDIDIALAWSVQAKNSLYNFHGFSPYLLVFGMNPRLPNVIDSKLPALEEVTTSEYLAKNLNAMMSSRQAYVRSESENKLKRALRHNVSGAVDHKYYTGDSLYKAS